MTVVSLLCCQWKYQKNSTLLVQAHERRVEVMTKVMNLKMQKMFDHDNLMKAEYEDDVEVDAHVE